MVELIFERGMRFVGAVLACDDPAILRFDSMQQLRAVEAFLAAIMPITSSEHIGLSSCQQFQKHVVDEICELMVSVHHAGAQPSPADSSLQFEQFDADAFNAIAAGALHALLDFLKQTELVHGRLPFTSVSDVVLRRDVFQNHKLAGPIIRALLDYCANHSPILPLGTELPASLFQADGVKECIRFLLPPTSDLDVPFGHELVNEALHHICDLVLDNPQLQPAFARHGMVHFLLTEFASVLRDDLHACTSALLDVVEQLAGSVSHCTLIPAYCVAGTPSHTRKFGTSLRCSPMPTRPRA